MSSVVDKVQAFLSTFAHLDIQTNLNLRHPSCKHTFLPASLNIGTKNNDEFAAHMGSIADVIEEFPVTVKQILYDEGGKVVTAWATSTVKFKDEAVDHEDAELKWEYDGEYMFVFEFDEEREKIVRVFEFLDSKRVEEVWKLLGRAKGNLERRKREGES